MPEIAKVLTTDAEIDAAIRQARIYEKYDRRAVRAAYSDRTDRITLYLDNGATYAIPRRLVQGLTDAAPSSLHRIELLGRGTGLYWPALDVAHSVSGLLAGIYGSEKWMSCLDKGRRKALVLDTGLKMSKEGKDPPSLKGADSANGLNRRHRNGPGRIEKKRGDTLVRTLRQEFGEDFLRDFGSDTKLSTVRKETDMSLTELVRRHRRGK